MGAPVTLALKQAAIRRAAPAPRLRLAATRCSQPGFNFPSNAVTGSGYQTSSKSYHVATSDITSMAIAVANFKYGPHEVGCVVGQTVRAAVHYGGVMVGRFTFKANRYRGDSTTGFMESGLTTGSVNNRNHLVSDVVPLDVKIPSGAAFFIKLYMTGNCGWTSLITRDAANGDLHKAANTVGDPADVTGSTTNPSQTGGGNLMPMAILSPVTTVSVIGVGDSLMYGQGDTTQTDGRLGCIFKTLTMPVAFLNLGYGGGTSLGWWEANINRREMLKYASTVIYSLGSNDICVSSQTASATLARATVYAQQYFPTALKKINCTLLPRSTSPTLYWSDLSDQTGIATAEMNAHNDAVKAGTPGFDTYFDLAAMAESATNSNKWAIPALFRNVSDASMSSTVNPTFLDSTNAAFAPSDVGYGVVLPGFGAAGGVLLAYIVSWTSASRVVLSSPCLTTVASGGTARIGTPTLDGIHPVPAMHTVISGAVNAAQFV